MTEMGFRFRAVAGLAAASLFSSGCASFSQSLAANKRTPGVIESGAFKPALPPADAFGPNPRYVCQTASINTAVQDALADRFKGKAAPEPEGRLCAIAETLLGWPGDNDEMPPERVRAFLSSYFGLPVAFRQVSISLLDSDDSRALIDPLAEPVASFGENAKVARYGLVTVRVKKGAISAQDVAQGTSKAGTRFALVLQDQNLELLAPLPRQLPPGGSALLQARALGPVSKIKTEIVDAGGKFKSIPSADQSVQAQLTCGDRPGKILVQVSGETEGVDTLLANFMVACGGELATSVQLPSKAAASTPAQDEQRLFDLINAERAAAGLAPFENNPALSGIARNISDDLGKNKPTSSSALIQAMREADVASPVILESAARALSASDAFERLATTPSDRATILNSDANQAGVGVAPGPLAGKVPTVVVTALFIKQVPPADPVAVKSKLYEAIAQRRKDARADPLDRDAVLESVAQKYADAAAAGSGIVPPEKQSEILAPLYKESMTVNQVGGFLPDEKGALDVAQQPAVMSAAKLVGVGVALGRSPQFGKNSPFVVAFFGTRHKAQKKMAPKRKK
jgi:uncharacterized protein YkwD